MENGHTLHLVVRQQAQSQDSSGTSAGETSGNNGNQGTDSAVIVVLAYQVTKFFR